MKTIFSKEELHQELKELKKRMSEVQSKRVNLMKKFNKKSDADTETKAELHELELKIENVNWKLDSLF